MTDLFGLLLAPLSVIVVALLTTRASRRAGDAEDKRESHQVDVDEWDSLVSRLQAETARLALRVEALERSDSDKARRIGSLERTLTDFVGRYRRALRHLSLLQAWAKETVDLLPAGYPTAPVPDPELALDLADPDRPASVWSPRSSDAPQ